jgi:hypothetical protein
MKSKNYAALQYACFFGLVLHHPAFDLLNTCSSFNVREQVSHPYKIAGKIIVYGF